MNGMSVRSRKRPFTINQIVKAEVSYRPTVIAGSYYRVKRVDRAKSYSGWMVSVAPLGRNGVALAAEALDAGYFRKPEQLGRQNSSIFLA